MAAEIMVCTPAIRALIRDDKVHQIYSAMQVGQLRHGMQTFNQSLASLVMKRQITRELALSMSSKPDELEEMLKRGATTTTPEPGRRAPAGRR